MPPNQTPALLLGRQNKEKRFFPESWPYREVTEASLQLTHPSFPAELQMTVLTLSLLYYQLLLAEQPKAEAVAAPKEWTPWGDLGF